MSLVLHTKAGCGYCDSLRQYLDGMGAPYTVSMWTDYDKDQLWASLSLPPGKRTFPQLLALTTERPGFRIIGGFMDALRYGQQRILSHVAPG
jgi:glutaredoxin